MNRKEYIEKLEVIRAALLNLHAEFTAAAITDEDFRVAKEDEERRAKERKAKAKGKGKTKKGAK